MSPKRVDEVGTGRHEVRRQQARPGALGTFEGVWAPCWPGCVVHVCKTWPHPSSIKPLCIHNPFLSRTQRKRYSGPHLQAEQGLCANPLMATLASGPLLSSFHLTTEFRLSWVQKLCLVFLQVASYIQSAFCPRARGYPGTAAWGRGSSRTSRPPTKGNQALRVGPKRQMVSPTARYLP